jgi:hypothetical protein
MSHQAAFRGNKAYYRRGKIGLEISFKRSLLVVFFVGTKPSAIE